MGKTYKKKYNKRGGWPSFGSSNNAAASMPPPNGNVSMQPNETTAMMANTQNSSGAQPSTYLFRSNVLGLVAAFNKLNYNYPAESRALALQTQLNNISQTPNLGNYSLASAASSGMLNTFNSTNSFLSNAFGKRSVGGKTKRKRRNLKK